MIKILFVCHGNICRSPLAEYIMKEPAAQAGFTVARAQDVGEEADLFIASAATSAEEIGNPIYPPTQKTLLDHGIGGPGSQWKISEKRARQIAREDYDRYDYLVGMDEANRRNLLRFFGGDPQTKISLLLDHTDAPREVSDPWYTRDFDKTYRDVEEGCHALLQKLLY